MAATGLSREEREEIRAGLSAGETHQEIADRMGRHRSTVTREVARNGGETLYQASAAHRRAHLKKRRRKLPKLALDRDLGKRVSRDLGSGYSPAAIAAQLRREGGPTVCHETIYRALYERKRFWGIVGAPETHLRTRRHFRRSRNRIRNGGTKPLRAFRLIHERSPGAADRSEAGHWEGDLMTSQQNKSAVITLVERKTRKLRLAGLPGRHSAPNVRQALTDVFRTIPPELRNSLTWDQGFEMSEWAILAKSLDLPVFFCDPRSPWQRPSNENTNRHLRFWLPRGLDLRTVDQSRLNRIEQIWNSQPRRSLDWQSSTERYDALLVR